MIGLLRNAAALSFGALAGALLLVLLVSSQAALGPGVQLAFGPLWLLGLGFGLGLAALCQAGPSRLRLLGAVVWGAFWLAPLMVTPGFEQLGFWDTVDGAALARRDLWQLVFVAAGVGAGGALAGRLGLRALGFAVGVAWVAWADGQAPLDLLPWLVAAGFSLLVIRSICGRLARRKNQVLELGFEVESAPELVPVLRSRLAGVMLLAMLAAALCMGTVAVDVLALTDGAGLAACLVASGFWLWLGACLGHLLARLARLFPGAELAPFCCLFTACVWLSAAPAMDLGALGLVASDQRMLDLVQASLWLGPMALCSGAALVGLPMLGFRKHPGGLLRGQLLVAVSVAVLGALAHEPVRERVLVVPGPGQFVAGMLLLGGVGLFLMMDLRRQGVGVVGGRLGVLWIAGLRGACGVALLLVALDLMGPGRTFESYPGQLVARSIDVRGADFGLDDRGTGAWLVRPDWINGGQLQRSLGGLELSDSMGQDLVQGGARLGRLLGLMGNPELVQRGGPAAVGWGLDVTAGGADWRRAVSAEALGGHPRPVVLWIPLDLRRAEFEAVLDELAVGFGFATLWMLNGQVFVVAADAEWQLDLGVEDSSGRTAASFVGVLKAQQGSTSRLRDWDATCKLQARGDSLSMLARNLERLGSRRTLMPASWMDALGELPEAELARALLELRVAVAWVASHRVSAPGSIALETWLGRLEEARLNAGLLGPLDDELLSFDKRARAEDQLDTGLQKLRAGDAHGALELLFSARRDLAGRGDLEIALVAALDLAGRPDEAKAMWAEMGARGPALLSGPAAWLGELGFAGPE